MNKQNPETPLFSRHLLSLLLALVLALAPLTGRADEFVLLYSNDDHGEVDPCG
jgi:hypothetical protein